MYRAFICAWSGEAGGHISNPIQDYLGNNDPGFPVVCSQHYPDADADGVPDKPLVLVLAWQPNGATDASGNNIESLGNLSGVYMLPAYRFSKPVSEIPSAVKDDVLTRLENRGIPRSTFSGVNVYGDFLRFIASYFNVNFAGFGDQIEIAADEEFA